MTEPRRSVLVGDQEAARSAWLLQFLNDFYNAVADTADTFDKVCQMAREAKAGGAGWTVIFLADTLPYSYDYPEALPPNNFSQLAGIDRAAKLVCVVTGEEYPVLSGVPAQVTYISLSSAAPTDEERDQIINSLQPLRSVLPLADTTVEEVARLTTWNTRDRTLRQQIRSLSRHQNLNDGERHLHRVIRNCLDCRGIKAIRVEPLTQGKSGALVFRLSVTPEADAGGKKSRGRDYALKLSKAEQIWKLASEVNGYLQAAESELYSTYKAHLPELQVPRVSKVVSEHGPSGEEFKYIASSLPWDAIYYDFLGGSLGEFMALDTALRANPAKRLKGAEGGVHPKFTLASDSPSDVQAFRVSFLETLLDALCELWYVNGAFTSRKVKRLWRREDAPERQYVPLPPYQLPERSKRWLHEFFDGEDAGIGPRLFAEWDDCRERLLGLVDNGPRGKLAERVPVTLSPVHGDLNAGNVFLWLKQENFPFLIDLPFYQREGHVLQDFARLEVEVKFALMDRQEESPREQLAAYDYSPQQVPLWRELEDYLLDGGTSAAAEPDWRSPGFRDNVSLTCQLVKVIRDRAERAQQQPGPADGASPVAFMDEYLPALLYHTVRAVTYPSLSLFKRMLAVYSAGMMLKKLDP